MSGLEQWIKKEQQLKSNSSEFNKLERTKPDLSEVELTKPDLSEVELTKPDLSEVESTTPQSNEISPKIYNSILNEFRLEENALSESLESNPLWNVLVQTVESDVLFSNRLAYVRQEIFSTYPDISPEELTDRTGYPLGVSMVVLHRLRSKK